MTISLAWTLSLIHDFRPLNILLYQASFPSSCVLSPFVLLACDMFSSHLHPPLFYDTTDLSLHYYSFLYPFHFDKPHALMISLGLCYTLYPLPICSINSLKV